MRRLSLFDLLTSLAGILSLLFWAGSATGGILLNVYQWLPDYQLTSEILSLVIVIVLFAIAVFLAVALLVSLGRISKVVYAVLTLLSLACALVPGIVLFVQTGSMPYIDPTPMYFYWFWLAVGGSLFAFLFGLFIVRD
jgi:hypothetical protein